MSLATPNFAALLLMTSDRRVAAEGERVGSGTVRTRRMKEPVVGSSVLVTGCRNTQLLTSRGNICESSESVGTGVESNWFGVAKMTRATVITRFEYRCHTCLRGRCLPTVASDVNRYHGYKDASLDAHYAIVHVDSAGIIEHYFMVLA